MRRLVTAGTLFPMLFLTGCMTPTQGKQEPPLPLGAPKGLADVVDGNVDLEHYARFQVHEDGDTAVVLVNALEMYQGQDFNRSGGQLQLQLFLEGRSGVWTVVKTDETTLRRAPPSASAPLISTRAQSLYS